MTNDTYETLEIDVDDDGIATLRLARSQKRNALSMQTLGEIQQVLERWHGDAGVRVVVVTGTPPAFCAGFDLGELTNPELIGTIRHISTRYHRTLWGFAKPVVAAVNGHALAGGLDLITLCDLRIAAESATFGHPEVKFGAPPLFTPLRWLVGDGIARDLCLTGRRIDAREAERVGLVSRVVADEALMEEAFLVARGIAEAPQACLETTKHYMTANGGLGFQESFSVEHDWVFDNQLRAQAPG
jgi:enoyl-CoA hydratase